MHIDRVDSAGCDYGVCAGRGGGVLLIWRHPEEKGMVTGSQQFGGGGGS